MALVHASTRKEEQALGPKRVWPATPKAKPGDAWDADAGLSEMKSDSHDIPDRFVTTRKK